LEDKSNIYRRGINLYKKSEKNRMKVRGEHKNEKNQSCYFICGIIYINIM